MKTAKAIAGSTFLDNWTFDEIKAAAKKLRAGNPKTLVGENVDEVLQDIEWIQECAILGSIPPPPGKIADIALRVGLRWMAIQSVIEHPKGKGKASPELEFIRKASRARCNRGKLHKEIVADGLARFEKATGQKSKRPVSDFTTHFKRDVINKKSP